MNYKNFITLTIFTFLIIFLTSCGTEPDEKTPCPNIRIVAAPSYISPIWHPSNKFIGFNYIPLDSITYPWGEHCAGNQYFNFKNRGFYLINIDGNNQRRILPCQLQTPQWSPDGKWIAFGVGTQIYKMPFDEVTETFDTTQIIQLTNKGRNFSPSWSPDGKWIAYDSNKDSPNGMNFIWKMKSDGTEKVRIAYDPSNGEIRMPNWGKNNKITHIRYLLDDNSAAPEIFEMDSDGNNKKQLTKNKNFDSYPQYSPLGNKIAFFSSGNGASGIWLLDIKSLALQKIIKDNVYGDDSFSWSPNGKQIVYSAKDLNRNSSNVNSFWIVDIYLSTKYQLTFNKKVG